MGIRRLSALPDILNIAQYSGQYDFGDGVSKEH